MELKKVSQYFMIGYLMFILAIKPVSLILFWLVTVFGLYWLIKEKINPFKNENIKFPSLILFFYFIAMAMSVLMSNMPGNTFGHLDRILYLFFAPITAVAILKTDLQIRKFIFGAKIGAIIAGSIVLVEAIIKHFHFLRLSGLYNANTFGDISVLLTFLSITLIPKEDKKDLFLSFIALLMGVIAIIFSGSRGSLIGFIILFVLYIIINLLYNKKSRKLILIISLISIFTTFVMLNNDRAFKTRISVIIPYVKAWQKGKKKTTSVGDRLEMYSSGFKAFKKSPIFGYGYQECGIAAARYATQTKAVQNRFKGRWHLHNEFVTTGVNAGIVGIIALLFLYLVPLIYFIKNMRNSLIARAGTIFMIGIIVLGTTHTMIGYEYETSLIVTVIIYLMYKLRQELTTPANNYQSK